AQPARVVPAGTTYILLVNQPGVALPNVAPQAVMMAAPPARQPQPEPLPLPKAPPVVANVPAAPAPAVGAPPPPVPAKAPCAAGHCADHQHWDCQHLRDWVCYHSIRGGCYDRCGCGCNCSIPLYVYFLHECHEGKKYELPPCVAAAQKEQPNLFS